MNPIRDLIERPKTSVPTGFRIPAMRGRRLPRVDLTIDECKSVSGEAKVAESIYGGDVGECWDRCIVSRREGRAADLRLVG
jgi:hypothetical protein